jgi:hypothetical protein
MTSMSSHKTKAVGATAPGRPMRKRRKGGKKRKG